MFKCENCPYHYKGEDDKFACCHFEGNYLAPCDRTAQAPTNKKLTFLEDDDYEGEPYEDEPVYENEDYDNMSDEDWEQELNAKDDYDDEPFEDVVDDYDGWDDEEDYQ